MRSAERCHPISDQPRRCPSPRRSLRLSRVSKASWLLDVDADEQTDCDRLCRAPALKKLRGACKAVVENPWSPLRLHISRGPTLISPKP